MPHVNFAVPSDEVMAPGHLGCAGCGGTLAMRLALKALGRKTVLVVPACCWSVIDGPAPYSAAGVPLMHTPFASAAAAASGVRAGLDLKGDTTTTVCAWAGDGGTFDIGLQALSAAAERNENILYICYDNEAYMNTGVQRSSATPFGAWTTTTPAQHVKDRPKKDLLAIMAAHGIPYAATATVAYPDDLIAKVRKAAAIRGTRFIHLLAPCPPGWKIAVRGRDPLRAPRRRRARLPALRSRGRTAVAAHRRARAARRSRTTSRARDASGTWPAIRRRSTRQAGRRRALAAAAGTDRVTMHTILSKDILSPDVVRFWIEAPAIARKRRPGQFVIVRSAEGGERIPLTIADADPARGAISLVVQGVGKSTMKLNRLEAGDAILDVAGPLGQPTRIAPGSRVCCIGGGIGTAVAYPIAAGVKAEGGRVVEHHRRAHARPHHPRSRDGDGRRRGARLYRRRQPRHEGARHRRAEDAARSRRDLRRGRRGRAAADDARGVRGDAAARPQDDRQPEPDHGGRHRHVRRLPRDRRRRAEVRLRGRPGIRRPRGGFASFGASYGEAAALEARVAARRRTNGTTRHRATERERRGRRDGGSTGLRADGERLSSSRCSPSGRPSAGLLRRPRGASHRTASCLVLCDSHGQEDRTEDQDPDADRRTRPSAPGASAR